MFDYKYTVKSSDGYEWGLFKTRAQANIMCEAMKKYNDKVVFKVVDIE